MWINEKENWLDFNFRYRVSTDFINDMVKTVGVENTIELLKMSINNESAKMIKEKITKYLGEKENDQE